MTLEQLAIFVAVAEREHLTQGAAAIGLTPSAASAAIKALEAYYGVPLFDRVGRRIALTRPGRTFLDEARQALARARQAEQALSDLGGLKRGTLAIRASQTVANYWLPPRLLRFARAYPGIAVTFSAGNSGEVAAAVAAGEAELGVVEGAVDGPSLASRAIARDRLVVVTAAPAAAKPPELADLAWVMREPGSGTRSEFEAALRLLGIDPAALNVLLELPTNEAVLSAIRSSDCAAALSELVVGPLLGAGALRVLPFALPRRSFSLLRHRERPLSAAARAFEELCRAV